MGFSLQFLFLCLSICHGALGCSVIDLVDKLQNLEKKFVVMTKTVAHLTTENDDLRARVTVLEGLISSDENTTPLSKPKEETNGISHNPESATLEESDESEQLDDLQQNTSRHLVNVKNYDQRRKSIGKCQTS